MREHHEYLFFVDEKVSKRHRDYCCVIGPHPLIFLPLRLIITLPPPQIIWCHTAREKSGNKMSTSNPHRNPIGVYTNQLSRHDYRGIKLKVAAMIDVLFLGLLVSAWPSPPLTMMRPDPPSGGTETRRCSATWSSSGPASQVSSPESDVCDENRIWRPALKSAYFGCLHKITEIEYREIDPRWGVIILTIHHHYFLSHEFLKNSW